MKPLVHHPKIKPKQSGKLIVCADCGMFGGTMVKQGDHYVHQDKEACRILQLRRKR